MRTLLTLCLLLWTGVAAAQDFTALARLDPAASGVRDAGEGLEIDLALSQPVPWRVFTLDEPRRLVLDFREVDWQGAGASDLLSGERAEGLRLGTYAPGWSRMVVDLAAPQEVAEAGMRTDAETGRARVRVTLAPTTAEAFAASSGAPDEAPLWQREAASVPSVSADDGVIVVAIDPGHGGVDPGAMAGGVSEADLMLQLSLELAEAVARAGMVPVLTRAEDDFVPLGTRMSIAREAGADLLLSLHADALEGAQATGASIYTLAEAGQDRAAERLAERHGRGDLLGGLDLSGQDDRVAGVLMDLARLETAPEGERLAAALVEGLRGTGARLNSRPRREAVLAVLQAADFPSVLVEAGFLSNPEDRARLATPQGRGPIVSGIVRGIEAWAAEEAARAPLRRR
ncbi:N-acetylmuramoyl-L-alanine amidase [Histidinibacterium aquaticum]|uniref:N-acetylmuramoyl-L-alanine amidase n=1 Tax=Histidinibacterium aquaticum TaxID=2613962 RepID=A0A5J5GKW4_9RHOB|nr:N-acetylmuramoyl-L-alanine amidase [Histidinibacterium aquaticum]KAA9008966.1 N-acetylmuramoyl-L-alanine amidase [Histidinibacterium aquaticum]